AVPGNAPGSVEGSDAAFPMIMTVFPGIRKAEVNMYDLSIVLPTCNRGGLLESALAAIWQNTSCNYEIIVVDGASYDRTTAVLTEAREDTGDRLKVITETEREGFVKAANKGFRAAGGRYVVWLNDDARPL